MKIPFIKQERSWYLELFYSDPLCHFYSGITIIPSGFILERALAPLAHIFYKWRTENLTKGPTRRTNFREKIYLVQNSFCIKTSEFTYRVLPSNIYRSLNGRLFFTLFTVAIMSDNADHFRLFRGK